eukprot:1158608-Pelagomonas_calceolata.AAC.3
MPYCPASALYPACALYLAGLEGRDVAIAARGGQRPHTLREEHDDTSCVMMMMMMMMMMVMIADSIIGGCSCSSTLICAHKHLGCCKRAPMSELISNELRAERCL